MKKAFIVVIIAVALILAAVGIAVVADMNTDKIISEYTFAESIEKGPIKIKLPEKTIFVMKTGMDGAIFETELSEQEVQDFYDSYFSDFKKIYYYAPPYAEAFYNEKMDVILGGFRIYKQTDNGKTRFMISYQGSWSDEQWITSRPKEESSALLS